MKFKRTKPFLLATAGSTVDGRTIDEKMLEEMARSYDPKTYGARLNIEHIRGLTGDKPFRSYGDVVELSLGEVDVNFNGTVEKRKALYGVFDVLDDAQQLNAAGQKVYPSIEIEPDFGGKGFAYLMGCALTDSPASIATERLSFNVTRPGALNVGLDQAASLEFADTTAAPADTGGFLNALTAVLEKFTGGKKDEPAAPARPADPATLDHAAFTALFADLGKTVNDALVAQAASFRADLDRIELSVTKLRSDVETTAGPSQTTRPPANGTQIDLSKVF